jgi:hypothetical protein
MKALINCISFRQCIYRPPPRTHFDINVLSFYKDKDMYEVCQQNCSLFLLSAQMLILIQCSTRLALIGPVGSNITTDKSYQALKPLNH